MYIYKNKISPTEDTEKRRITSTEQIKPGYCNLFEQKLLLLCSELQEHHLRALIRCVIEAQLSRNIKKTLINMGMAFANTCLVLWYLGSINTCNRREGQILAMLKCVILLWKRFLEHHCGTQYLIHMS